MTDIKNTPTYETESRAQDLLDFKEQYRGILDRLTALEERRLSQSSIPPQTIKARHLEDTGWISISLQNSWVNYDTTFGMADTSFVRKIAGIVYFRGLIKSGTTTSYTTIFTLPKGWRPAINQIFVCSCTTSGYWELRVLSNGTVQTGAIAPTNGWTSLSGVSFIADQ